MTSFETATSTKRAKSSSHARDAEIWDSLTAMVCIHHEPKYVTS
jgi:hypothetical protein